jgi:hypothetical protein
VILLAVVMPERLAQGLGAREIYFTGPILGCDVAAEPRLASASPAEPSIHLGRDLPSQLQVDRAVAPVRLGPRYLLRIMSQALPRQTASALRVPFAEFFDHFLVERRNIVGLATGNESVIHHHFLVHPIATGIFHIGLNVLPRR